MTAARLAGLIGVSSRTVKSEMSEVANRLTEHGAHLESKRNSGYWIVVDNQDAYQEFVGHIQLLATPIEMASYDHAARVLYIERRLVASYGGARVDEICEELALSRTAVRSALRDAVEFCKSYHLQVNSAAEKGISVVGEEHMVRLALTELFEIHFHEFEPDESIKEYAQWVVCDYQERQDIRHDFLRILREGSVSLRDGMTQRLAMYLIIARNRIRAGCHVVLPTLWVDEAMGCPCYAVAREVMFALAAKYEGFSTAKNEIAFFAIYMLCNLDLTLEPDLRSISPYLYPETHRATTSCLRLFEYEVGLPAKSMEQAVGLFERVLLPLVAANRYDMNGCERYDYDCERSIVLDPLCMCCGAILTRIIERALGGCLSHSDACLIASIVALVVRYQPIPKKPLRVISTCSLGKEHARCKAEGLRAKFPDLVGSIVPMELYEVRGVDPAAYDAVLTDVESGYRYDAPNGSFRFQSIDEGLGLLHDSLLIRAYDIEGYCPTTDCVAVQHDIHVESISQLIQAISLQYTEEAESVRHKLLHEAEFLKRTVLNHRAFLFDFVGDSKQERITWYQLDRKIAYGGEKITSLVFARLFLDGDLIRLAMYARMFAALDCVPSTWDGDAQDLAQLLKRALRGSFSVCGTDSRSRLDP